ncbi:MAG: tetratricopeptide repeat protein [Flavobacteriaceae bacterium]|jgi:tetratricopeptide (TPR) repeat protein|nr:tetratricopeptide repeat protein [Flavobacteriaceae bacterium]
MKEVKEKLEEIKKLYNQLTLANDLDELKEEAKVEAYQKNQELSEDVLRLIDEVIEAEPTNSEVLFWKIKLYNGPHFEDVSIMLSTAEEIIERFKEEKKSLMSAYDWLAWIYDTKLDLKEKAIELFHDKLIEISLIKEDYSLQATEFGETYYLIAQLYKEKGDLETAGSFYKLAIEQYPDHYYATYQGGMLFFEREDYDAALPMLQGFHRYHGNEYSSAIAKVILEHYESGRLKNRWDYLHLMYSIGLDYPKEMDCKDAKEFGQKYSALIDRELEENPNNLYALRMKARHYLDVDKNSKKAFEILQRYFGLVGKIEDSLYFMYYELGQKVGIDIEELNLPIDIDAFYGYNLMTRFLEKAGSLRDEEEDSKALVYYQIAKKIGKATYPKLQLFLKEGKGDKINNNAHGFAMLCNNLGIAIRNVEMLTEGDYKNEDCELALRLHQEGYDYSPFWENLDSGMRIAEAMEEYDVVIRYGEELLTYYDAYSNSWMVIKNRLLENLIHADRYEEAEVFFQELRKGFEKSGVENEDVVREMIEAAANILTYVRYQKKEFQKTIDMTEDFFANPIYFDLNDHVAYVNYWFSLGWSYHGLNNSVKAQEFFDLLKERYDGGEDYQATVDRIPEEYTMEKKDREAFQRLHSYLKKEVSNEVDFSLTTKNGTNERHIEQLVQMVCGQEVESTSIWFTDSLYVKMVNRHETDSETGERFDWLVDVYLPEEHVTIRYDLIESEEVEKSLFGMIRKKVRKKEMYVFFYHYEEGSDEAKGYVDFEEEEKHYKNLAQSYWNWLMNKGIA